MGEPKYSIETLDGVLSASSFTELITKIEVEREYWENFSRLAKEKFDWTNYQSLQGIQHLLIETGAFWRNNLDRIISSESDPENLEFGSLLATIERQKPPPLSSSNTAEFIDFLLEKDAFSEAAVFYATIARGDQGRSQLFQRQTDINSYAQTIGDSASLIVAYIGSTRLQSQATKGNEKVANKILQELANTLDLAKSDTEVLNKSISEKKEEVARYSKRVNAIITKRIRSEQNKIRSREQKRADRFLELENAFKAHLRIKHPVELWTERERQHEKSERKAALMFYLGSISFALSAIALIWFGGDFVAQSFLHPDCSIGFEKSCNQIYARGPLAVGAIVTVSTIWLWFLRLQMKIRLSERHLKLDARERRSFAESYLSLLEGGSVTTEQEAVVLTSMFRPTEDGIVRDDGAIDPSLSGILAKLLERGR